MLPAELTVPAVVMHQLVGGISYMGNSLETETASEYGSVKEGILSDFDYDRFCEAGILIGSGEADTKPLAIFPRNDY